MSILLIAGALIAGEELLIVLRYKISFALSVYWYNYYYFWRGFKYTL